MNTRALMVMTALLGATPAPAVPPHASAFRFFATSGLTLSGNRVQCGLLDRGMLCTDAGDSPVNEGGFWPSGSANNYVFNSGLQIAAISSAGDTVGAFFFDSRGDQGHGSAVTPFADSRAAPADRWPAAARLLDTALFDPSLIGRNAASQQDVWVRYWDGDTQFRAGRKHPMGILVDQRTLAWNYPVGNEDIVYEIFRIVNVSAADPSRYTSLSAAGYSSEDIAQIAALGRTFQARMRLDLGIAVPDSGYSYSQTYVAYNADDDVGDAGHNFTTASLPFSLMTTYKSDFNEPTWTYPAAINASPFAQAPGFVAQALLRAPGGRDLHFFTQVGKNFYFPDPVGTVQLWNGISATMGGGLGYNCSVPSPQARRFCWVGQVSIDARSMESVGPLTLAPGQSEVVVMALVFAAPVRAPIASRIGIDIPPGLPVDGTRLAQGLDTVKAIDSAMGWLSSSDLNGDGTIEANEVTTVPRSLLWKTQLAQAFVNARFLSPAPPERPNFFVVPGDRNVQVVWQKSATEQMGDPFFPAASDPTTPLYDPDYRKYDVEGYRVWRGMSPSSMQMIAQFDYPLTQFLDYDGQLALPDYGLRCAPELGVSASCPAFPRATYLNAPTVQVRPGDRVLLSDSSIAVLRADTAVTGGASGYPPLRGNGVAFSFIDTTAVNGVTYYYAVTAFDVNSIKSGPSSLESSMLPKSVTPRASSAGITGGAQFVLTGRGSTPLDPAAPMPAIDRNTGNFTGPVPPTNGLTMAFTSYLPFVPSGRISLHIDSIAASNEEIFIANASYPGTYFTTVTTLAGTIHPQLQFVMSATDGYEATRSLVYDFPPINMTNGLTTRFGGDSSYVLYASATLDFSAGNWALAGIGRGAANCGPCATKYSGPVMWTGVVPPADANGGNGLSSSLNLGAAVGDSNGGRVAGVSKLWHISGYLTVGRPARGLDPILSSVYRAADFAIYWGGTAGRIDSVIDVTHNVVVPFNRNVAASWGILNDSSFTNTPASAIPDTSVSVMTWTDAFCVYPVTAYQNLTAASCGGLSEAQSAFLMNHAITNPINFHASQGADNSAAGAGQPLAAQGATGTGFLFYLAGTFWVVQTQTSLAGCCQNAVWHMRTVAGGITGGPGVFGFVSFVRPPAVPGLTASLVYTSTDFNVAASTDTLLDHVHTVPDPYYLSTPLEALTGQQLLRWVNVPPRAIIRVYTASGILVALLTHNDATGGGEVPWNLTNRNGHLVASGVYFWELTTADGKHRIGRFTLVTGER